VNAADFFSQPTAGLAKEVGDHYFEAFSFDMLQKLSSPCDCKGVSKTVINLMLLLEERTMNATTHQTTNLGSSRKQKMDKQA
jgi:hypothetical protein